MIEPDEIITLEERLAAEGRAKSVIRRSQPLIARESRGGYGRPIEATATVVSIDVRHDLAVGPNPAGASLAVYVTDPGEEDDLIREAGLNPDGKVNGMFDFQRRLT